MSTVEHADISTLLKGQTPVGTRVTVRGWVRTRRDSKAGLSFIHVHDGSGFDPIQVVAPAQLPNYESEIKKLTSGCAVMASGVLVQSQGQGQSVEVQADSVEVVGWVDDPDTYPIQPKKASFEYLREVAHLRPRTNTLGAIARVPHAGWPGAVPDSAPRSPMPPDSSSSRSSSGAGSTRWSARSRSG